MTTAPAHDPFRPRRRSRATRESRTKLEQFTVRLRQCGAAPDEIAMVAQHWDNNDPECQAMLQWDDRQIVEAIAAVRTEWEAHTDAAG